MKFTLHIWITFGALLVPCSYLRVNLAHREFNLAGHWHNFSESTFWFN